jgi:uncharacterized membrane protein YeaQ/YmgE (transglycosylase-associated protein family)
MPDDQHSQISGVFWQCAALLILILWLSSIVVAGIAGSLVCGFLADSIAPQMGKDSFFVQCCVTIGGVVGAIAGGYFATKLVMTIRRRYPKVPWVPR